MVINSYIPSLLNLSRVGAALVVIFSLSSCVSSASNTQELEPQPFEPIATQTDGSVRGHTTDKTVARLWAAAEIARKGDDNNVALQLIYEALELAPQNALLWSRAAEIQLDLLQAGLAESYATKSNAHSNDEESLLYRNWLIIKHSRDMQGDLLGARSAQKMVEQFQFP